MAAIYIISKIDGEEYCKSNGAFAKHLRNHNITYQAYHEKYITGVKETCPVCGKPKKFYHRLSKYARTCGNATCSIQNRWNTISEEEKEKISNNRRTQWKTRTNEEIAEMNKKRKETNNKKYGGDTPMHSVEVRETVRQTCVDRYGADSPFESQEIKRKIKQSVIDKYGVEHPMQSDEVKEKVKQTNIKKYGVEYPSQSGEIKEKMKQTNLDRYGVEYASQSDEVKEKVKQTNIKKYGVEYPSQSGEIKEKMKQTNLDRYGVENPSQSSDIKKKKVQTCIGNYGVENPSQSEDIKQKKVQTCIDKYGYMNYSHTRLSEDILSKLNNHAWLMEQYESGGTKFISNELGISINTANVYLRETSLKRSGSSFEIEIRSFIESLGISNIVTNDRKILEGKELDIYLPDQKIAIECNGSYWHSELQGKPRQYHIEKTKICKSEGIHLIHIWHHDWISNEELIKSRIKSKIGCNKRVYARKCIISAITAKGATEFMQANHIQGSCPGSARYGLFYDQELLALMTFGKSRYKKDVEYELLRYCSKQGINVVGGASKLFRRFIQWYEPKSIISYSDRMWNTGGLYEQLGFVHSHSTDPAYHYTIDYLHFENRVAYQKHKLEAKLDVFDPNLTEWENMQANGFDRIWDCGNDVWVWKDK